MSEIKYINAGYEYIILREGKELGMSSETLRYIGKLEREIKRLNNIIKDLDNTIENLEEVIKHKDSIIKEAIEDNSDDMHTYISQAITQILKGSDSNVKD